jgi:predicted acyltransferase
MSQSASEMKVPSVGRLVSLDVFRGMTIAGMVLVNNPGSWAHIYWPLEHAEWSGWTPTDLIFPFFLFIVGVAIPLALGRRIEAGNSRGNLFFKICKRSLIIFLLGEFLAGFPYFHLSTIRIPGVLQRIAVCYFFAALIFLTTRARTQAIIVLALLVVYWQLMMHFPVPDYGPGDLSKEGNLAAYVDRHVFGAHVWRQAVVYDPEGLLSTMGALATTLLGVLTGHRLRCATRAPSEKLAEMFIAGICCLIFGWAWNAWFPINKALWTSSYVFFTAGLALEFLGLCYWLIEIKNYRRWARPFVIFGVNPIALFVGSGLMERLLTIITVPSGNATQETLWGYIYGHAFASWLQPNNASLAFAIVFILFWLFLMWLLDRKGIIIRI